ncbi:hypothetical protein KKE06_04295 [Candidatus Micrarchaeota archaeon]|nr:hypothetical protein [Candidatus Micrarchaeota archaeon]MBU1930321.1 hypothetical protein [Candidatus Micrarchaeota archaeon]
MAAKGPANLPAAKTRRQRNQLPSNSQNATTTNREKNPKKNEKGYQLNPQWLEEQREKTQQRAQKYAQKTLFQQQASITANSLYEVDSILLDLLSNQQPQSPNKEFLGLIWNHFWLPLFVSKKEYLKLKNLGQKFDLYAISINKTPLDEWCTQFWNQIGGHAKIKYNPKIGQDFLVYPNTVIQVYYPKKILQKLNQYYKKTKTIKQLDINQLFEQIMLHPTPISITINQNQTLANQLKNQILNKFKK